MNTNEKNKNDDNEKNLDYWRMVNLDTSKYEGATSIGGWIEADAGSDCGVDA